MSTHVHKYGWKKDPADHRDHVMMFPFHADLPAKADLRDKMPPVYDQNTLGSCVANSIGGAHHYNQLKQNDVDPFIPSRLFIYFNAREMEGTINEDAGAFIRDGMKAVAVQGVCPEPMWPYVEDQFATKPGKECYVEAEKHQALRYARVRQDLHDLKQCLVDGYPIAFGFKVYSSMENAEVARTGMVPMPGHGDEEQGGHAVLIVGYDDAMQRFIVRNSWGAEWGDKGYFYLPYAYVTDSGLSSDFWTIRFIEV